MEQNYPTVDNSLHVGKLFANHVNMHCEKGRQMKEKKRKELIESAIKLFAKDGFTNTSVQNIVNDCGISKGAFYHHFSSKEELHIAIFEYYFEQLRTRTQEIDQERLNPRDKMKKQLNVPFEQLNQQKEFLMVYMREQNFSINKQLREVMEKTQYEMLSWYEKNLIEIFGEKITAYTGDIILLIEGIRTSYLAVMLFQDLQIDTSLISNFMMNRIDDMVESFENGEVPIMKNNLLNPFSKETFGIANRKEKVLALLADMKEQLEVMKFDSERKEGLQGVIDFLSAELKKPELESYIFQGMLANLKAVKEFDIYREKIAKLLGIQLL